MAYEDLRVEIRDLVCTITLAREAKRNALSSRTVEELAGALAEADADDAVRVVVLTGAGEKAFCSGGDLAGDLGKPFLEGHEGRRAYGRLLVQMRHLGRPLIARVNGYALGGGLGLVAACDLAVAADDSRFGTPEMNLGLFPWMIAAVLYRTLPAKAVNELVFTGEKISAERALQIGLLNRVVPRDGLDDAVAELAAKVASKSPAILRLGRRGLATMGDLPFEQAVEFLASQLSLNVLTEDALEGVAAFMQKRPPQWKGR